MNSLFIPEGYKSPLDVYRTQKAIAFIKKVKKGSKRAKKKIGSGFWGKLGTKRIEIEKAIY